nr:uncharacterized protein LOC123843687 [Mirounga angustirostris]
MPGPGAGLLRVFVFSLRPNVACVGRSGLGPEAAPRLAPGSAGSSSRFPQRATPRRREGQKRRDKQIRPQLSATERQRERRAAGPQPAVGRGVCFCLPAPDRGPSPWQPQRARLRAPASGSTRGSGPRAGGTEAGPKLFNKLKVPQLCADVCDSPSLAHRYTHSISGCRRHQLQLGASGGCSRTWTPQPQDSALGLGAWLPGSHCSCPTHPCQFLILRAGEGRWLHQPFLCPWARAETPLAEKAQFQ